MLESSVNSEHVCYVAQLSRKRSSSYWPPSEPETLLLAAAIGDCEPQSGNHKCGGTNVVLFDVYFVPLATEESPLWTLVS
jgi:hypothetical protein